MPTNAFPVGDANPRWRGGKSLCATGYVRRSAGKYRFKYEHMALTLENLDNAEIVSVDNLRERLLKREFEIHHFDGDREHNCYDNLQILQKEIHRAIEISKQTNLGVNAPQFPWQKKREAQ